MQLELSLNFWQCLRTETVELLCESIGKILKTRSRVSKAKIGFSSMSIAGGVTSTVGMGLLPVTLGGSLGLSILGGLIAVLGGVGSSTSTVVENIIVKRELRKVYNSIEMDTGLCKIILAQFKSLEKERKITDDSILTEEEQDSSHQRNLSDMQLSMDSLATKHSLVVKQKSKASALRTGCVLGTSIGSVAVKGFMPAGNIITIPLDIYEILIAIRHHKRKHGRNDVISWKDEQLKKIQQDIERFSDMSHQEDTKL